MGREVRRVPANWQHPKDSSTGRYIPLHDRSFTSEVADWNTGNAKWQDGLRNDYHGGWKELEPEYKGQSYSEFAGAQPRSYEHMPDFPEAERTHWQMYETWSEGTPISPPMASPEELARWLADNHASAFGGPTASYEAWLATIQRTQGAPGCESDSSPVSDGGTKHE